MRILTPVAVALTVAVLGATAANAGGDPAARSAALTVGIYSDHFSPASKTIRKGATVKWVWVRGGAHNVTVESGPQKFATSTMTSGTFSKTLKKTGTYKILCTVHGFRMQLKVKKP